MGGLEEGSVSAAGDDQVGIHVSQIGKLPVKVALMGQCFDPFLLHTFLIEHCLERNAGLFGVVFGGVDDNDDLADFHRSDDSREGWQTPWFHFRETFFVLRLYVVAWDTIK